MKIKEKVKKFTKEHKDEIVFAAASAGAVVLSTGVGFILGQIFTYKDIEKITKVDLTRGFAYNIKDVVLKDVLQGETVVPESLKEAGITSLEDSIKAAILVQKK